MSTPSTPTIGMEIQGERSQQQETQQQLEGNPQDPPQVAPSQNTLMDISEGPLSLKEFLIDRDITACDPTLVIGDLYNAMVRVHVNAMGHLDLFNLYHSHLVKVVVPQVYHFPELISWVVEKYDFSER